MSIPVVFIAFANDKDQHLPLLEEERRAVNSHLLPLASKNFFQLYTEPSARIQDITDHIIQFKNRIHLFHYGGHADGGHLFFTDQAANSSGIAELLAAQENLKLVFLNGCSTKKQVDLLLELGIPAVIATSVPIEDPAAKIFSDVFYDAMAKEHTIEEAFNIAAASHQARKDVKPLIYRGVGRVPDNGQTEALPWGLYVREQTSEVLDWKIPMRDSGSFIARGAGKTYSGRTINESLIITIANTIKPYSPKVNLIFEEARKRKPSIRDLRAAVIDSFPTPIGTHLRKLLLSEETTTARLEKIVNVYSISTQLFCYVLLSQLWDEKHKNSKLVLPDDQKAILADYFNLKKDAWLTYDYAQLIRAIGDIFVANSIDPFLEEFVFLRKEFYENETFFQAYQFLEEMKKELQGTISADEIESFCVQAEDHLGEIFKRIGYAARYTMVAVKNVEVEKERHNDPTFKHNLVILDRVTASFGILDESYDYHEYSENESVLILDMGDNIKPYLNLSPFIIDENALSGQTNSKLYFINYFNDEGTHYLFTDNLREHLLVNDKDEYFPGVDKQIKQFKRQILGI